MGAKATYFQWVDACGSSGWYNPEDCKGPMHVESIGFVVKEDKESITIAPGRTADGQYMGYVTVPKGWIKKRKTIRV